MQHVPRKIFQEVRVFSVFSPHASVSADGFSHAGNILATHRRMTPKGRLMAPPGLQARTTGPLIMALNFGANILDMSIYAVLALL